MTHWFKQREFGHGSAPTTWQGWVTLIAYPVIMVLVALAMFFVYPPAGQGGLWRIVLFLVFVAVATYAFIVFVRSRTSGTPRWRSGPDK